MEEDRCRACDVITIVEHFVFGNESGFRPILSLSLSLPRDIFTSHNINMKAPKFCRWIQSFCLLLMCMLCVCVLERESWS